MKVEAASKVHLDKVTNLAMMLWPENDRDELEVEFEQLLESEKDIVYVAVIEGESVGFVHMSLRNDYVEGSSTSPVGYIEGIYVEKKHRNKGISKKLVEAGEAWAKSLGCAEVGSDAEFDNIGSHAFHKKIGFKEAGRIVSFIKEIE